MNPNPQKQGVLTENASGLGVVTRQMVLTRARELAVINRRSLHDMIESDWAQAKRELTGQPELDPKTVILESAPEAARWDPLPGDTGRKVPAAASEDEDEEGRSDNEKLTEAGVAEAEHDQMVQARKTENQKSKL